MAVADRDELWEVKCQYIVSLMVLRRRASRSGAGRAVRGMKMEDSADAALIRLFNFKQRQWHAPARCVPLSGADTSVSCVHAGIVSSATCTDFSL